MRTTRPPHGLPSFAREEDAVEPTSLQKLGGVKQERRPYLLCLAGASAGTSFRLDAKAVVLGRGPTCTVRVADAGVSREHVRITATDSGFVVEDLKSANGTFLNGAPLTEPTVLTDGDKIHVGALTVFKFALFDELDERYERRLRGSASTSLPIPVLPWTPDSWREKVVAQDVDYSDPATLERVLTKLRHLPPLVTSWEIEDLKRQLAEAQEGRRFLLQGGDCAESFDECTSPVITNKLKILIQMSLVLIRGSRRPVIRVGRFAGQYAKPRSSRTETRGGLQLPSYFGDLVNRTEFTAESREPNPTLLLDAYYHSAVTLNFIRALCAGGFADLRRPEYFDLSFFERAELPTDLRVDYSRMSREVTDGLHFLQAVGDGASELLKVSFFASHEGLHLLYEAAQTRRVPRREGHYDLTTHFPWIGERTRALDGAHVEFFRGIRNPIGVKLGPAATPEEVLELCDILNPANEPGKLVFVTRLGAGKVAERLEPLVSAVRRAGRRVLWVCDPMHGNAVTTAAGVKTRNFEDILREIEISMEVHEACTSYLGGVHFELTGEDVTECIGGGLTEADLSRRYASYCDPRLNYRQAIQMAFCLSRRLNTLRAPSTIPPPGMR